MKALAYPKFGPPHCLQVIEIPRPIVQDNEVLIKVDCAGVNPIDWKIGDGRISRYFSESFPMITGRDICGTVEQVGRNAGLSKGTSVIACLPGPGGAFAEYVSVNESLVALAPTNLSAAQSASIPLVGLTCWQALVEVANIASGDVLYVLAGAGGTGSIAIQLAAGLGASVITTCSIRNREYVKSLGAGHIYDYTDPHLTQRIVGEFPDGVDVVFSNSLGPLHREAYKSLRKNGKLVTIGEPPLAELARPRGIDETDLIVRPNGAQLAEIVDLIDQSTLKPPSITKYDLADGVQAMLDSCEGHTRGKIVLQIS